jgi:hypothetical protein
VAIFLDRSAQISGKCTLCQRQSLPSIPFCNYHERAHSELKSRYSEWVVAFGSISWERYLETLVGLKEIGVWAGEVARFELRQLKQASISNQSSKETGSMPHGD